MIKNRNIVHAPQARIQRSTIHIAIFTGPQTHLVMHKTQHSIFSTYSCGLNLLDFFDEELHNDNIYCNCPFRDTVQCSRFLFKVKIDSTFVLMK